MMTTEAKQKRDAEHNDMANLAIYNDDICVDIDCYFDEETQNLWHAYVGDHDIFNVLQQTTIAELEREFAKHVRKEAEDHNLDLAISRWESQRDYQGIYA